MKFVAYILAAVILLTVLLAPCVELLSAFGDMCKISAAVSSAGRAAVMNSEDVQSARDVEAKINFDKFQEVFKENFCTALNLDSYYRSNDGKFNNFTVKFELLSDDKCKIEVRTAYKFKTSVFKTYASDFSNNQNILKVSRIQTLIIEN